MTKQRFIAYYDYGTGSVLMFIYARSASEITQAYPELTVLDALPAWVTPDHEAKMAAALTYDLDAKPSGVLEALVRARSKP